MVNDKRNVGILILFSFLTCGIYNFFFTYDFVNDMNRVCNGDGETTPGLLKLVLLSICTCGIYGIYWRYKVAVRQQAKAERYGIHMPAGGGAVLV